MMRLVLGLWMVVIMGSGYYVFSLSYNIHALEDDLARMQRNISQEQENIRVLHAEWAWLNAPERLNVMVANLTDLVPVRADQLLSDFDELAWRPAPQQSFAATQQDAIGLLVGEILAQDSGPNSASANASAGNAGGAVGESLRGGVHE